MKYRIFKRNKKYIVYRKRWWGWSAWKWEKDVYIGGYIGGNFVTEFFVKKFDSLTEAKKAIKDHHRPEKEEKLIVEALIKEITV